jgi:hypothetical protein
MDEVTPTDTNSEWLLLNAKKLLKSYLENRRQRIKIGNNYSEWDTLIKGVPQGSILGPVLPKTWSKCWKQRIEMII